MHPQAVRPKDARPDVGLMDATARKITALLCTLE
jgi:hypothetical protein